MKASIEFLYSGTVHISEDNVAELLDCAEYLQIDELKELCSRYLDLYIDLNTDNCLKLCLLSSKYNLEYYNKAYKYFSGHLTELLEKDEMLQLTPDSVMYLISDDTLRYVSRKMFFEFLIKWVEYDVNHREQFFVELFFEIDLLRLEREYIATRVLKEELIKKSFECTMVVGTKLRCKDNLSQNEIGANDLILVAGGTEPVQREFFVGILRSRDKGKAEFDAIYAYSPWDDRWEKYISLPTRLHEPCLALLSTSDLYIVEGGGITDLMLNVYKLNVRSKNWTSLRVSLPSCYGDYHIHGIISCNNSIFVVASGSEYNSTSTGPCMDGLASILDSTASRKMRHILLLKINESESSCEIASPVFKYAGKRKIQFCSFGKCFICVLCTELDSPVGEVPEAMFIYDESSGKLLNRSKRGCSGQIYCNFKDKFVIPIIGDTAARHKVFFIDNKHWRHDASTVIPHMPFYAERTEFPCIVYSDGLYVMGGKITDREGLPKYLQSVLRFDFQTSKWNTIHVFPTDLVRGVCVLKRPVELDGCHSDCPHCIFDAGGAESRQYSLSKVNYDLSRAMVHEAMKYYYYDDDDHFYYDSDDYYYGCSDDS